MLVLSRKLNEKIHLGDDITVTVLRVHGNVIRLGIEAPQDVRILRGELERLDDGQPSSKAGEIRAGEIGAAPKQASKQPMPKQTERRQGDPAQQAVSAHTMPTLAMPQRRGLGKAAGARPLATFVAGTAR